MIRSAGILALLAVVLVAPVAAGEPAPRPRACPSTSLRRPNAGRLRCGRPMPKAGKHHYLQPYTLNADIRYGTDELVEGLLWVAEKVTEPGDFSRIAIGNLSVKGGGDNPLSRSHESGRDVDIPFQMTDRKGRPIGAYYHHFDDQGLSLSHGDEYRFDVARNWRVVEAILACPVFEVKGIVVSAGLRKLLLDHARGTGVDPALLARAEELLVPPWRATPHDNHFHLRIACTPEDAKAGCEEMTKL